MVNCQTTLRLSLESVRDACCRHSIDWIMKTTLTGRKKRDTVHGHPGRKLMTLTERMTRHSCLTSTVMQMEDKTTRLENALEALGLKIIKKQTVLKKLCTTADTPGKCD